MQTYSELLNHELWQNKRLEILERDDFTCKNCQNKSYLKFSIATFDVKPQTKDSSSIMIHDELGTIINIKEQFKYFSKLKGAGKSTILAIYNLVNVESYIYGFAITSLLVDNSEVDLEFTEEIFRRIDSR